MNFDTIVESILEPSYKDTTFKVLKKKWYSSVDGRAHDEPLKFDDCPLYVIKDSRNSYWEFLKASDQTFVHENIIHKKPRWFWNLRRVINSKGHRSQYLRHSDEGKEYIEWRENLEQNVFPKLIDSWLYQQRALKAGASKEQAKVISNI